jgi:hypothetical protein
MLSSILLIIEKVFTNQKKEERLQVVQERLRSKKEQVRQEPEVLKTHYLEVVVEFLVLDHVPMIKRLIKK